MKAHKIYLAIAITLAVVSQNSFAQRENPDSVKAGKFYNILLSNDEWIKGEILSIDSQYVKIKTDDGSAVKFARSSVKEFIGLTAGDVEDYYGDVYGNKKEPNTILSPVLSLSGGIGLTSFYGYSGYRNSGNFPAAYVVNLEGILYFSRHAGIRLFVDCNFFGNDNNSSYGGYGYNYYQEEGGNKSVYMVTVDILAGSLKPEEKTKQYFTGGFGAFVLSESEGKSYYNDGLSSYTSIIPGTSEAVMGLKLGYGIYHRFTPKVTFGGELLYGLALENPQFGLVSIKPKISYRLSKKLELFFEPQYTFPVAFPGGYFEGGFFIGEGYFTVKSGLTLGSF